MLLKRFGVVPRGTVSTFEPPSILGTKSHAVHATGADWPARTPIPNLGDVEATSEPTVDEDAARLLKLLGAPKETVSTFEPPSILGTKSHAVHATSANRPTRSSTERPNFGAAEAMLGPAV